MLIHPIAPVYDGKSRILILGSFPSVKSREQGFFYGHPQNRFWRVTAAVLGDEVPGTVPERRAFLLRHGIALWDVIAACEISGSSDASIRDARVNDLRPILRSPPFGRFSSTDRPLRSSTAAIRSPSQAALPRCCPPPAPPTRAGLWIA